MTIQRRLILRLGQDRYPIQLLLYIYENHISHIVISGKCQKLIEDDQIKRIRPRDQLSNCQWWQLAVSSPKYVQQINYSELRCVFLEIAWPFGPLPFDLGLAAYSRLKVLVDDKVWFDHSWLSRPIICLG